MTLRLAVLCVLVAAASLVSARAEPETRTNVSAGRAAQQRALRTPYRDDRSTPAAVLRSLYSAVNREEYARAYSYWSSTAAEPDGPPPYPAFVRGYEATARVVLVLGPVRSEGAAGSIYSAVPVRLLVTGRDGLEQTFVGCYLLRQLQPAIQEPPFRPIGIVSDRLRPSRGAGRVSQVPSPTLCAGTP